MIPRDEIHLWSVPLDVGTSVVTSLAQTLAPDEIERARRLRHALDRWRFVTRRAVLRLLLARYLGTEPWAVRLRSDEFGKLAVVSDPENTNPPDFSISASAGLALYAFAAGVSVGIDVERVERSVSYDDVARRYFTPSEQAELRAFSASERQEAFFRCWTRKEAYVKACGDGLSHSLSSFDVSLAARGTCLLRRVHGSASLASSWTLAAVTPAVGFVAAVAARRPALRLAVQAPLEVHA
jgi:4'-phosphopantetheinyl transferase